MSATVTERPAFTSLSAFLPPMSYGTDARIEVPAWAFMPDQWSAAFLNGLYRCSPTWRGKRVWEVGVGTGVNLIALSGLVQPLRWYFSDFDQRCVPLALRNITRSVGLNHRYHALSGSRDLLNAPDGGMSPTVEVIFGCLPQVPVEVIDLGEGDNFSHYYCPKRYPKSHLHPCGLGLVEALLKQARDVLTPRGEVVLNLGGRPGQERLLQMFAECDFEPAIVHVEVVPQHAATSLASLAALENGGHADFEFFADAGHEERINARHAEHRRLRGQPVFHRIYVIKGTLT